MPIDWCILIKSGVWGICPWSLNGPINCRKGRQKERKVHTRAGAGVGAGGGGWGLTGADIHVISWSFFLKCTLFLPLPILDSVGHIPLSLWIMRLTDGGIWLVGSGMQLAGGRMQLASSRMRLAASECGSLAVECTSLAAECGLPAAECGSPAAECSS